MKHKLCKHSIIKRVNAHKILNAEKERSSRLMAVVKASARIHINLNRQTREKLLIN